MKLSSDNVLLYSQFLRIFKSINDNHSKKLLFQMTRNFKNDNKIMWYSIYAF